MSTSIHASTIDQNDDRPIVDNNRTTKRLRRVSSDSLAVNLKIVNPNYIPNSKQLKRRVTLDDEGIGSASKKLKMTPLSTSSSASSSDESCSSEIQQEIDDATETTKRISETATDLRQYITTENPEEDNQLHTDSIEQGLPNLLGIVTPHPSSLDLTTEITSLEATPRLASEKVAKQASVADVPPISCPELTSNTDLQSKKFGFRSILVQLLITLFVFAAYVISKQASAQLSFPNEDCIFVPGGGFSGFWFFMGRLQSIPDPHQHNFVCYSAGCLGSVAALGNVSVPDLYDIASTARDQFLNGERHRYDIVEYFVDNMLEKVDDTQRLIDSFDKLHVLTSVTDPKSKLPASQMESPTSMEHLKDLLLETTWIPLAIGSHYSHKGQLDGAFSLFQHPTCKEKVGLAWNFDLLINGLNPNIGAEKVSKFWNLGLDYGL